MFIVDLLKARDGPGGEVPYGMEDVSSVDTVMIYRGRRQSYMLTKKE